jgi:hypothetical protein
VKVLVLKNWAGEGLKNQWPSTPPVEFSDISFVFDEGTEADHAVVLNGVANDRRVRCPPDRVWAIVQEPPTRWHRHMHRGQRAFSRIYTSDVSLGGSRYRRFWSGVGWHVGRSYDELVQASYPRKSVDLAWVTSNSTTLPGHKKRMRFLRRLAADVPVELWGRGIRPIECKWDALSPARYSIAFENHAGTPYWSEKITDCFLAYSTPIYYGSNEIGRYFPRNSFVSLDPDDPLAIDRIKDLVASRFHEEHFDELMEARDLCLHRYNTLFFIAREIEASPPSGLAPSDVIIKRVSKAKQPLPRRIWRESVALAQRLLPPAVFSRARRWYRALKAFSGHPGSQ